MLIKNAKLRDRDELIDLLIEDGKFIKIEKNIESQTDEIIDVNENV